MWQDPSKDYPSIKLRHGPTNRFLASVTWQVHEGELSRVKNLFFNLGLRLQGIN